MLDTSLPHIPIVMTCERPGAAPSFPMPAGYRLSSWKPGLEEGWCEIERACGEFSDREAAMERFCREFLPFPEVLSQRMWFALAPDGSAAATATLWQGAHLGKTLPRIHWVATHPAHEGKGLAKGLLSAVMGKFSQLETGNFLYLTSQTWSWPAVRLYKKMGFCPLWQRPVNWKGDWEPEAAWKLIEEKIAAFEGR